MFLSPMLTWCTTSLRQSTPLLKVRSLTEWRNTPGTLGWFYRSQVFRLHNYNLLNNLTSSKWQM
jgi:hypothetical protein